MDSNPWRFDIKSLAKLTYFQGKKFMSIRCSGVEDSCNSYMMIANEKEKQREYTVCHVDLCIELLH